MNDDPTSSVAGPSTAPPDNRSSSRRHRRRRGNRLTPAQTRAFVQMSKKIEYLKMLMSNIDLSVYIQLCALYYMDCSLFQLLLRGISQFIFLTPKPVNVRSIPQSSFYTSILLGSNILCIFLHLFQQPSASTEEMRGYLHGGMIIDLIGQKGPTSKLKLVLFDLVVLALQIIEFTIHAEKDKMDGLLAVYLKGPSDSNADTNAAPSTQDHDAEERGVLRDTATSSEDNEMLPLDSAGVHTSHNQTDISEAEEAREELLAEPDIDLDDAPLDMYWSGTAIIGNFNVLGTLRSRLIPGNSSGAVFQTSDATRRWNAIHQSFRRSMNS